MNEKHKEYNLTNFSTGILTILSSIIVAILLTISLIGIISRHSLYPTKELILTFVPNDGVNLILVVPLLILSIIFAKRGFLIGYLFWVAGLFFVIYHAIFYVFAFKLSIVFLVYLTLLMASIFLLVGLCSCLNPVYIRKKLENIIPARSIGWLLIIFGSLFFLRTIGVLGEAIIKNTLISVGDYCVLISDFFISIAWLVSGILLIKKQDSGYLLGTSAFIHAHATTIGLLICFILQPILTSTPFAFVDFSTIAIFELIWFVPIFIMIIKKKTKV